MKHRYRHQLAHTHSLQLLEQALDYDPIYAGALNLKAGVLLMLQRYHEALKASQGAIILAPEVANAWINMGTALRLLDRPAEAAECFRKASILGDKRGDKSLSDMEL